MTNLIELFESLENDDLGDVSGFENPDEAEARAILADYNRRSGEHFDFSYFKIEKEWPPRPEKGQSRIVYRCPLYASHPDIKYLLPEIEVYLEITRRDSYPIESELKLVIWGNHVIRDLVEHRGTKLIRFNGKDVE